MLGAYRVPVAAVTTTATLRALCRCPRRGSEGVVMALGLVLRSQTPLMAPERGLRRRIEPPEEKRLSCFVRWWRSWLLLACFSSPCSSFLPQVRGSRNGGKECRSKKSFTSTQTFQGDADTRKGRSTQQGNEKGEGGKGGVEWGEVGK